MPSSIWYTFVNLCPTVRTTYAQNPSTSINISPTTNDIKNASDTCKAFRSFAFTNDQQLLLNINKTIDGDSVHFDDILQAWACDSAQGTWRLTSPDSLNIRLKRHSDTTEPYHREIYGSVKLIQSDSIDFQLYYHFVNQPAFQELGTTERGSSVQPYIIGSYKRFPRNLPQKPPACRDENSIE